MLDLRIWKVNFISFKTEPSTDSDQLHCLRFARVDVMFPLENSKPLAI